MLARKEWSLTIAPNGDRQVIEFPIDSSQERFLTLSPERTARFLLVVVLGLTLASLAGQYYRYFLSEGGHHMTIVRFFDLDSEANLPTWYSSATLLLSSFLLAIIAWAKKWEGDRYALHWSIMAFLFLGLSLDEASGIHEMPIEQLRAALHAEGIFYFTWVIPGAGFVGLFLVAYLRFLAHLPALTRWLFLLSGMIFVGGAIGVEMISGYYSYYYGQATWGNALITTVEEVLEMLGIVLFIYALLHYMRSYLGTIRLRIA